MISKPFKSPYLASVISVPKYLLKCSAISLEAHPKNPVLEKVKPDPFLG